MKRNLLNGIILIGAIALSSCSSLNKLAKTSYTGDDVYFTKAQAGDSFDYMAAYTPTQTVRTDDYYYYGDYESRINRFSYYSPFSYDDDFYYDYAPSYYSNYGFGVSTAPVYDYAYSPIYDLGVYSAFDFGYGNYWGFDNFGYGYAYSTYVYSGGVSKRSRTRTYPQTGYTNGGVKNSSGLAFSRGGVGAGANGANGLSFSRGGVNSAYPNSRPGGSNAVYPGRPGTNSQQPGSIVRTPTNTSANPTSIRPISESPRYTAPTVERSSPPPSSSGGGSSGSSSSSGGGGRPVRP
jgi:hypothetical protein